MYLFIRNLPDVSVEDFSKVDLNQYKWIHWEVRGLSVCCPNSYSLEN